MLDVVMDTVIDALKILPFLFIAFLIIELIEHKFSKKSIKIIEKSGKFGPLLGGVLGCFPQCGFSVMATNLYVTRIISLGTLISVYLSTSDEMLPILISRGSGFYEIMEILLVKVFIGIVSGFIIDFILRKKQKIEIHEICESDHCHCEKGIISSSLVHTFRTLFFIMLVSFILNVVMYFGGEDIIRNLFSSNNILSPFIASLIGLIPNCAASVVITELYLSGILSFSSVIAGLLTGSGVALIVLFKSNSNMRENMMILLLVYLIGSLSGVMLELINFII